MVNMCVSTDWLYIYIYTFVYIHTDRELCIYSTIFLGRGWLQLSMQGKMIKENWKCRGKVSKVTQPFIYVKALVLQPSVVANKRGKYSFVSTIHPQTKPASQATEIMPLYLILQASGRKVFWLQWFSAGLRLPPRGQLGNFWTSFWLSQWMGLTIGGICTGTTIV